MNRKQYLIIFLCLFFQVINALHPIVLIPGDGGSQLEAKINKTNVVHYICDKISDYFSLWLNIELLVPVIIDCWIDNVKLIYDNVTRTTRNNDGVSIRIPGFGSSETVEWIDPSHASAGAYFKYIADELVKSGYVRNVSIRGAPYDFRKAPYEILDYFKNLKNLIEETYYMNGNQSVVLICHSMGAPMAMLLLQNQTQQWKDQFINSIVTLSGAWAGSMKALKVFAIGDDLGSFMLRQKSMREEQITAPSTAMLLPSRLFWKEDEVLVQTNKFNYTINDLQKFFNDIEYPIGWEMRKDTEKYLLNFTAPGVEIHCLHGIGVPTVDSLLYKKDDWINEEPTLINGDGDGTVNYRSLSACLHWEKLQPQRIYHVPFKNVDHMDILQDKLVLNYLDQLFRFKINRH